VEADEDPAEAAVREVREETGLSVRLVPGPRAPMPSGFPHPGVCPPWWVVEFRARADNHTADRHVHVDHVWSEPRIAEDSRLQAKELSSSWPACRAKNNGS
jgi:8-oxo-dGTP pyrophosphatase MutT (NUDIX family)